MRSMRASTCSALSPASTTNGSIGVCRKRDFFFMRCSLEHKTLSTTVESPTSERSPDADVDRRAIGKTTVAIVSPRGADRGGERRVVAGDDAGGELAAGGRFQRCGVERGRPRVAGIRDDRALNRVQEHGPGAGAPLRPGDGEAVLGVDERRVTSGEGVRRKAAKQAYRAAAKIGDRRIGSGAAEQKGPSGGGVAVRRSSCGSERDDVMGVEPRKIGAR